MEQLSLILFLGTWAIACMGLAGLCMVLARAVFCTLSWLSMRTAKNRAVERYCAKAYKRL